MPVGRCTSGGGDLGYRKLDAVGRIGEDEVEAVAKWHQKIQLEQIVAPNGGMV